MHCDSNACTKSLGRFLDRSSSHRTLLTPRPKRADHPNDPLEIVLETRLPSKNLERLFVTKIQLSSHKHSYTETCGHKKHLSQMIPNKEAMIH